MRRTHIEANRAIFDERRMRVYASVGGRALRHANSIVSLDPLSGTVRNEVVVGSEPRALALSVDGSALWVALEGVNMLRRLDPVTFEVRETVRFPSRASTYVRSIVPLPDSPTSIAVTGHDHRVVPSGVGNAVLDDGVARPVTISGWDGADYFIQGPPGSLLGWQGGQFMILTVSASGLSVRSFLRRTFAVEPILYLDGFLLSTSGYADDVSNVSAPRVLPDIAWNGAYAASGMRAVIFAAGSMSGAPGEQLGRYDLTTNRTLATVPIPGVTHGTGVRDLLRINDGLFVLVGTAQPTSGEPAELYLITPTWP